MNALEIRNLTKRFGDRAAVDNLSLGVLEGGALALAVWTFHRRMKRGV